MSQRQVDETEEKQEKRGEKEEKSFEEKWRRDPVSGIVWAAILIWAGLVLLAENLGVLLRLEPLTAWGIIFIGAGVILLLEAAFRVLVPAYRRRVTGTVILGVVFLAIGLGDVVSLNVVWPLILIVLGGAILLRAVFRGR